MKIDKFGEFNEGLNEDQTRISLSEDDFTKLVSGGEVTHGGVKIILQDIGWDNMVKIIVDQMYKAERGRYK